MVQLPPKKLFESKSLTKLLPQIFRIILPPSCVIF